MAVTEHEEPTPESWPLTTREGWSRFVDHEPCPPEITEASRRWGPYKREPFAAARLDYHSDLVIVNTPAIQEVTLTARRLILLNRRQISARRGLIVTGPAGTGKTTAITQLGRTHELSVRQRHPADRDRIPVLYVTVPPAATPKMLAVEFARFLGIPLGRRFNITDATDAVCGVLRDVGCDLVLVDEIHIISLATRAGSEVSDQLKYFSERIPATFVYAGIDLERVGLFSGTRGRQIAARFTSITTAPFPYNNAAQRRQWQSLVATLEAGLRLLHHRPGTLLELDAYLHQRTGGMIGSLSHLIRGAAMDAISDHTEKITKSHLDAVRIDHAAEQTVTTRPSSRSA